MPDSPPPPPLPPPPIPSTSNSSSSQQSLQPMFNSLELDHLIYSYLKESGYSSTSTSLLSESNLEPSPTQSESSGGHLLVKLLQKGLLYSQAEQRYLNGSSKRIKLGEQVETGLGLPPLPKKKTLPPTPPQPQPELPLPQPIPTTTTTTTATQSKGKGKGKEKDKVNEKKRKSSSVQPSNTSTTTTTSDQEPEGKRSRITSNDSNKSKSKVMMNGKKSSDSSKVKGKGKGKEKQIESDQSGDEQESEKEEQEQEQEQEEEDTRMKDLMPAPSIPIASTSSTKPSLPLPPPPAPPVPTPVASTSESQPQSSKSRLPPSAQTSSSSSLPAPLPPYKRPQITSTLSSTSAIPAPNSNSNSNSKRSQSPIQSRKPLPPPPPPPPAPAPTPVPNGPAKIRITTTTRNVPTPQSSSSLPFSTREGVSPIASRATNGGVGEKKDLGSGGGGEGGKKLMKVKNEESSSASNSLSSGSKMGNGKGAKGELSKEELVAKQKRKREREIAREKEREKEQVAAAREKEKEKEKERKERERERESKVDLSKCKRIKSSDSSVIKLRGHTVAMVQPCSFNSKVPTLLATGGGDSTCRIWDVPSPSFSTPPLQGEEEEEHIVCKHASAQRKVGVAAVAWDPSGSLLATGSEDGIARIWTPSGDLHLVLSMHQRAINSLRWAPSGTLLLTGSLDSTVCLWELSSGKVRQQYGTHGDSILDVDWNDDSTFASASMDKTVHLFTTGRNNPIHRLKGHRDEVNVVKFSPCGTLVATCSDDHTVRIWSLRNLPALASTINSKSVKKGDENRKIDRDEDEEEGDGEDGNERGCLVLKGHESEVHQISWKPGCGKAGSEGDGNRLIASCSFDHTAKLWDADEGTCLYTFSRHQDFVYSIAFEPTLGRFLATGSNDGTVMVWRIKDKALVLEYESPAPVYELTFNPPGTQIAVTGQLEQVAVVPFDGSTAYNS